MPDDDIIANAVGSGAATELPNPIAAPPKRAVKSRHRPGARKPPTASQAASRPTPPRKPAAKDGARDYTSDVAGIFQLAAAPLLVAGQVKDDAALLADAAAITIHAPGIASAVNDLATNDPRIAAILDKLLVVGPYGALLAATMPLVAQIATNHRRELLPMTQAFGAMEPDVLVASCMPAEGEPSTNGTAPAAARS